MTIKHLGETLAAVEDKLQTERKVASGAMTALHEEFMAIADDIAHIQKRVIGAMQAIQDHFSAHDGAMQAIIEEKAPEQ